MGNDVSHRRFIITLVALTYGVYLLECLLMLFMAIVAVFLSSRWFS